MVTQDKIHKVLGEDNGWKSCGSRDVTPPSRIFSFVEISKGGSCVKLSTMWHTGDKPLSACHAESRQSDHLPILSWGFWRETSPCPRGNWQLLKWFILLRCLGKVCNLNSSVTYVLFCSALEYIHIDFSAMCYYLRLGKNVTTSSDNQNCFQPEFSNSKKKKMYKFVAKRTAMGRGQCELGRLREQFSETSGNPRYTHKHYCDINHRNLYY